MKCAVRRLFVETTGARIVPPETVQRERGQVSIISVMRFGCLVKVPLKNQTDPLAAPPARNMRTWARVFKGIAASLVVIVLVGAVFHFSGDALLNRFLKPKLEQEFSAHLPGSSLHLGALRYDFWSNRLACDSAAMIRTDGAPASAGSISATGVHWSRLLFGKPNPAQIFSSTQLEVTDLSAVLPEAEYRIRCGHLHISVPASAIAAQALTLQLVASDEAFFASAPFRRVRYRLAVESCSLHGVNFADLLNGRAYRAQSVELAGPVLESLVNRDKPRRPLTKSPPMPHEALAAIPKPFRIDRLTITDGLIKYAARRFEGAAPGVLSFTAVQVSAKEIANAAAGGQAIGLMAEGRLMDAGTMTVQMHIPVAPSTLAFHYSGKLSAMDLTRLDDYMDGSGRIQIRSGSASEAWFDIDVVAGQAHGSVRGVYQDLHVKIVDLDTGSERGVANRVATMLTNHLKLRAENKPDKTGALKAGRVDYTRKPEETFLQFAWLALRTGVLDLVSLHASPSPSPTPEGNGDVRP